MRHNGLILFLFALFLFEGTVMHWLIPAAWQTEVKVAPQPVLVVIAMIGLYLHRYWGLAYGVGFGLLHDIVYYGPMIGTYTAAYGIVGYLSGMAANLLRGNILTSMFIVVSGNLLFEWIVYGIYTVFQITHVNVYWVFLRQMLPSVLINLLFALLIYVPVRKKLEKFTAARLSEEE